MAGMDEITAEYTTDQLREPAALRCTLGLTIACKTDLGRVRENNEDKFEYFLSEDPASLATRGQVFLVCDGMGGHAAGQIASELACKTYIDVYLNHGSPSPQLAAEAAVSAANRFVYDIATTIPGRKGMGTTLSALMLVQDQAIVAQVGDSRVYRLRGGAIQCLTQDHTWVDEAIKRGEITPDQASTHPYRHVLTRAIGTEPSVAPDILISEVMQGDTYLLCSDGVMNHVSDDQLQTMLDQNTPSRAAWKIVNSALMDGGSDNTTVIVVRVDSVLPV
jgi:protein phosphatase